jgi:hypothetical protein
MFKKLNSLANVNQDVYIMLDNGSTATLQIKKVNFENNIIYGYNPINKSTYMIDLKKVTGFYVHDVDPTILFME